MKKRLSNAQCEFIKGEVVDLFERFGIQSVPIDAFELARRIGIQLITYSSLSYCQRNAAKRLSLDGVYIETNNGSDLIFYNDSPRNTYARMNMTILHEIGHCVLDHRGESKEDVELEANFFAKYAAAPPPLVHRYRPQCPEDIVAVFHISFEAARYAYNYYLKWRSVRSRGI